jgi:hypothetical protein
MQKGTTSYLLKEDIVKNIIPENANQNEHADFNTFKSFQNNILHHKQTTGRSNASLTLQPNLFELDSSLVSEFLTTGNNGELFEYECRKDSCIKDIYFDLPQVTTASLVQDGQDIVNYLKQIRYSLDTDAKIHDFDVNSLISDFEQSKVSFDFNRLTKAVERLKNIQLHLGK